MKFLKSAAALFLPAYAASLSGEGIFLVKNSVPQIFIKQDANVSPEKKNHTYRIFKPDNVNLSEKKLVSPTGVTQMNIEPFMK